jgi:hypothetical protein
MITGTGGEQVGTCDGRSRWQFLKFDGLALPGFAFPQMLQGAELSVRRPASREVEKGAGVKCEIRRRVARVF